MMEQQFLTALNSIRGGSTTNRLRDKKANQITDFINATYQGHLSPSRHLQGPGTVIDDQFNYIFCNNWRNSKINGSTFIKLSNEITIWGQWVNNMPNRLCSIQVGPYLLQVPYECQQGDSRVQRAKKCIIINKSKGKGYLTRFDRNPEQYQNKRQYSIVIEKMLPLDPNKNSQFYNLIGTNDFQNKNSPQEYLSFLKNQQGYLNIEEENKGMLITARWENQNTNFARNDYGPKLGLFLDHKKHHIKSVGIFSKQTDESTHSLNGLGLSKTTDSQTMIGIFKGNMLVRQFNTDNPQYLQRNYSRNLNGSAVKEMLSHQHMKSLSYEHNYLYFPEVKKIVVMAIQMHKYVDMFERLSHQSESDSEPNEGNEERAGKYHQVNPIQIQQSSESIIDQYKEFRVVLKREDFGEERENIQDGKREKKPGFILHRSPTPNRKQRTPMKLNRRSPSRSPPRHDKRWRI